MDLRERFRIASHRCSGVVGSPTAFVFAVLIVVAWAATGPVFKYSDTWQLVINTGTTIVTFLMVFMIQATQNRDSLAIQLKLDELIRALKQARTGLVHLEDWTDDELENLRTEFQRLSKSPDIAEAIENAEEARELKRGAA